jgi:hypothetical protein
MLSPAFFKRLKQLRQQRKRSTEYQQYLTTIPAGAEDSQGGTWKGKVAQTIVYGPEGKAYPNPAAAMAAGASNFTYNIPSGVNVDWSYWNKFTQPPTTTPVPVPITVAPQNTIVPGVNTNAPDAGDNTNPPTQPPSGGGDNTTAPPTTTVAPTLDPFAGIKRGRLAEAMRFADAGMMGRAKQQVELGGGTWVKEGLLSQKMRKGAKDTDRYGGDYPFKGIDSAAVTSALSKIGSNFSMGKARKAIEDAGGTWTDQMHTRLKAEKKRQNQ